MDELASGLPNHVYPIFDLYGKCEKVTFFNGDVNKTTTPINEEVQSTSNVGGYELENNIPQCEKANLEVQEKETEILPSVPSTSSM